MSWRQVALQDIPPQPWRNGGGSTRELLAWPASADWRVRVSVATVDRAGAFSAFPQVQRWFAVLSGAGVDLAVDGQRHRCRPGQPPLEFDGGADVACELIDGPTEDLNFMVQGGGGRMRHVQSALRLAIEAGQFLAVYAHTAPAEISAGGELFIVPPQSLAWTVARERFEVGVEGMDAFCMETAP